MSHETEKYLVCPYNTAHTILKYRMNTHLVKCRKQHASLDWGRCVHNSNHHMPKAELPHHENHECPNRHSFQASIVTFNNEEFKSLAPIEHIELPDSGENWDDGAVNCFDPKENARQKSIIRGVHCVPPAERKAFRAEHRRHIQQRDEDESLKGVTKAKVKAEPMKPKENATLEPLRYPKELPKGFLGRGQPSASTSSSSSAGPVNPGAAGPALQGVQWSGLGRGSIQEGASYQPTGAWGRGRPRI
ncbi:gametocyte-specific factor 1 homolog isoform X2 [Thrips palmi]|nr:gametocyte-specific factor 1 homolog isoform X2 [Thrips palmi]